MPAFSCPLPPPAPRAWEAFWIWVLTGITSEAVQLRLAVWVIGIIGSIYAIFGGLRSVAVSDTLNGFGLWLEGVYHLFRTFGRRREASGRLQAIRQTHLGFNSWGADSRALSTLFTGVLLLNMFYWSTNQQIIQRTFGARSLKEGQKGVLIAGLFKIMAPLILVLPGIIAFHLYSAQEIAADDAYGTLVRNVLPSSLAGFFAAVMVGAILSSFNSALNSTATLFSLGIYKGMIRGGEADDSRDSSWQALWDLHRDRRHGGGSDAAGAGQHFWPFQNERSLFIPILSVMVMGLLTTRPCLECQSCAGDGFCPDCSGLLRALAEKWHRCMSLFSGSCLCPFVGDHGFEPLDQAHGSTMTPPLRRCRPDALAMGQAHGDRVGGGRPPALHGLRRYQRPLRRGLGRCLPGP